MQGDEVPEVMIEITENIKELGYIIYIAGFLCKGSILSYKFHDRGLSVLGKESFDSSKSQTFYSRTSLCCLPGSICSKLSSYRSPVRLSENLLLRIDHCLDCSELRSPCRIHRSIEIYLCLSGNTENRICSNVFCLCCQIICADSLNAGSLYVKRCDTVWRKCSKFRTHEEILHL